MSAHDTPESTPTLASQFQTAPAGHLAGHRHRPVRRRQRRRAADHGVAQRQRRSPRGLRRRARGTAGRLLHRRPRRHRVGCVPVRRADEELGTGPAGADATDHRRQRQAPLRRLPRRGLHAHAAARPCRRTDALDDLLRVPRPPRRHHRAGDRPPTPGEPQVPPRTDVPGVRLRRRPRRAGVRRRCGVGDRAALRRPPVPHPHQVPPRARHDPRRAAGRRSHRVRRRDVPHRRGGTGRRERRLRAVELHRLAAQPARRRVVAGHARRRAPVGVDRPRRDVRRVPRHPAVDDAAAHVHVTAEHVSAPPRPAQGGDEAAPQPRRDGVGDVRCLGRRGLHVEAAARHRCLHDVWTVHERVPGTRHGQAARPAGDRAQDRRGDGRHRATRSSRRRSASTPRSRSRPTRCSSGSRPRSCGRARAAGRATRSAR